MNTSFSSLPFSFTPFRFLEPDEKVSQTFSLDAWQKKDAYLSENPENKRPFGSYL
jgi:hypothetical protein